MRLIPLLILAVTLSAVGIAPDAYGDLEASAMTVEGASVPFVESSLGSSAAEGSSTAAGLFDFAMLGVLFLGLTGLVLMRRYVQNR